MIRLRTGLHIGFAPHSEAMMITASECRELAKVHRKEADQAERPSKASLLKNIARSLSSLAHQLEMLEEEDRSSNSELA